MPGKNTRYKPGYRELASWGWNETTLWSKVGTTPDENGCLTWSGSLSPTGALQGAYKKDPGTGEFHQQLTQARRLIWMSKTNEDVSPYKITMTCGNTHCVNFEHFKTKKTNRPEKFL